MTTNDKEVMDYLKGYPVKGVRYNCIRRSAHKSPESMYKKMTEDIADNRGGEWFSRWKVDITPGDIENFKQRTLNPILEQLCLWYDIMTGKPTRTQGELKDIVHWLAPYGVWNVLAEGGMGDIDSYLVDGSMVGLRKITELFTELNE